MATRFVGNDWRLVSTHREIVKDQFEDVHTLFNLVTFSDDREVWVTGSGAVELAPNCDKVRRRTYFETENGQFEVSIESISDCLLDEEGTYVVLHTRTFVGRTYFWRLNLATLELRLLGRISSFLCGKMSSDGVWYAGITNADDIFYVRGKLDHRLGNGSDLLQTCERCLDPEICFSDAFGRYVSSVDSLGGVVFSQRTLTDDLRVSPFWYWKRCCAPTRIGIHPNVDSFHSVGAQTYHVIHEGKNLGFQSIHGGDQIRLRTATQRFYEGAMDFIFGGLKSLLELSTLPHRDIWQFLCQNWRIEGVRWNETHSRVSIVWRQDDSELRAHPKRNWNFCRAELRVVSAKDSLLHACAAKIARDQSTEDLPAELSELVSNFRNAGAAY